jgi:tRNA A-37 threonylcarbamoyl transferase component Bud32
MRVLGVLATGRVLQVIWLSNLVIMVIFRRWRHLFVWLGGGLLVNLVTDSISQDIARPRPLGIEILGDWSGPAHPSRPVAVLAATLVGMLYALLPQGRLRQAGKPLAAAAVLLLMVAQVYLAVESPTDGFVGAVIGVTFALVAFRMFAPYEVFPVGYRRGNAAHLDVGGRRGEAIRHALEDQLGVTVLECKPFGLSGSAGSTPLRVRVKGDPDTVLFAKLYARGHLRADRWYKLGRTLLYGRLEDEKPFNTVRRLVQQEDYALQLLYHRADVRSPAPLGVITITPEREYLIVTEFIDGAREISDVEVDDAIIDDGLGIIRRLWDAGLAHRDVKPANLLVRDGKVHLIDVFFAEVQPSPWRQAVDLANMMLVLALRSDPERVYRRARLQFSDQEIVEAFAATYGITMPSQIRRLMKTEGRDLHAEFLRLLPERPARIPIQRWTLRRLGLTAAVVAGGLLAVVFAFQNLVTAGLL